MDFEHFDILAKETDANKSRLLIKKMLFIKFEQSQLNKTIKSFLLVI